MTGNPEEPTANAAQGFRDGLVAAIPNLRAFGMSLASNAALADDLVQETLLKAWTNRDGFAAGSNMKAWLFTILRNTYFSDFRKHRRDVQDVDGEHAATLVSLPEQEGHLDMADLRRALGRLPEDQREAVLLVGAEGFSYEQAATIADCAVGTMKSRVNRARAKLAEMLERPAVATVHAAEINPAEAVSGNVGA